MVEEESEMVEGQMGEKVVAKVHHMDDVDSQQVETEEHQALMKRRVQSLLQEKEWEQKMMALEDQWPGWCCCGILGRQGKGLMAQLINVDEMIRACQEQQKGQSRLDARGKRLQKTGKLVQ